jgi:LacI family transcriptional regulator
MTTLKDVAKEVGVSIATVSYVLNNTGSVSPKVSKLVLKAIEKLDYRPNRKAQAMRTGITKSIGLVLPDLTNPFFPELAQKIETEARMKGMAMILIDSQNSNDVENGGFNILEQHSVDGIIWCPVSDEVPKVVRQMNCPIVLIDRPIPGFDVIHSNYFNGGQILANYAIELGHKKIGLLSGPITLKSAQQRREGFLSCINNEMEIIWDIEVPFSVELNHHALSMLALKNVSLIVAADDLIAIGTMNALTALGLQIPNDVSVLGFDDIPWSNIVRPTLTTIKQPIATLATEAVDVLKKKITSPNTPRREIVLDVKLIVRDSTKAL